jgi:hypothetical protein
MIDKLATVKELVMLPKQFGMLTKQTGMLTEEIHIYANEAYGDVDKTDGC